MVESGQVVLRERGVGLRRLEQIGRRLARSLAPGDVVLLYGPLGSGKTTLVRMIAGGLGTSDAVRSPSFTLANVYSGPVTMLHLDLYRLESVGDEDCLSLEEYVRGDAVTLIEWPELGLPLLGPPTWTVHLDHETVRRRAVEVEASTPDAEQRWKLAEADDG